MYFACLNVLARYAFDTGLPGSLLTYQRSLLKGSLARTSLIVSLYSLNLVPSYVLFRLSLSVVRKPIETINRIT